MPFESVQIPANGRGSAKEELNKFLRGGRIASERKEFVANWGNSFWAFCIVPDGAQDSDQGRGVGPKVDYKEVLSTEDFAVFAKLRDLRKASSEKETIPACLIFTNEQLAVVAGKVPADSGRTLRLINFATHRAPRALDFPIPSQPDMKTTQIRRLLTALALTAAPLWAAGPDESNLTLVDTKSPPIRDLAKFAKDEGTYIGLNERNKVGVFFSERAMHQTQGYDRLQIRLLDPWENKSSWSKADFSHSSEGLMFFFNNGRYQPFAVHDSAWSFVKGDYHVWRPGRSTGAGSYSHLRWTSNDTVAMNSFKSGLNDPTGKVAVYKRFEFPTALNDPHGGEPYYADLDSTANKLVIVIHGWQSSPKTDPYSVGEWKALVANLHKEIQSKVALVPNWDLYAYRWGRDSYTGPILGSNGHAYGGIGLGVENGTQAAEIGYQHGLVLGKLLAERNIPLEKVHFIAHSAGTWVARSASLYLREHFGSSLVQQITLLDPYNPHEGWKENGSRSDVDDSVLGADKIESGWAEKILLPRPTKNIGENIYSNDSEVVGTNQVYGYGFTNREVGTSFLGWTEKILSAWNGHSGPINFYSYTVKPDDSTATRTDQNNRHGHADAVGWEHSLFMGEYKQSVQSLIQSLANSGYSALITPPFASQDIGDGPILAPASTPEWSQVLVDVDSNAWVRAMLIPKGSGAAVLAGPARLEADGTFAITLDDGRVLSGSFDTSTTPPVLTLALDRNPLGQPQSAAQGSVAQRGFDVNVNDSGNVVISAVLADGTTGMSVSRDPDGIGWEGSGVGTLDESGNFVVTGADGLQVTGHVREDGGLDTLVAPPQLPKIHVLGTAGTGLVTGAASTDCGRVAVGQTSRSFHFTIQSTGTVDLTDLGVAVVGPHGGDFAVSGPGVSSLAPDGSATVSVTFTPGAAGSRGATLRISSNDANRNPFEIALTGEGFEAASLDVAEATTGTLAAGEGAHFRVTVTEPGILIAWTEGGTDTHGLILAADGMSLGEDADSGPQANFRASADVVPGDFFIRVTGGDPAASGPYTLRTRFIPAAEPMQVSHFEKDGPDVMLGFTNTKGALHILEHSTDMRDWLPLETLVGQGAEMLVPLQGLGYGTTGFFRVALVADGYDPDVAEGIDQPGEVITPEGDASWFTQSTVSRDGEDAARSGLIYENQSSGFSMEVTEPVTVSFWWMVSSASGDELRFLIDGAQQAGTISGETGWLQQSHTLGSGTHTLTWSYAKNEDGVSAGQDCGWVDQVVFSYPADIAVEQPVGTELVNNATVDFGAVPVQSVHQRTFTIRNKGGMDLTGLGVSMSGSLSEFQHTQPSVATLAPGASTTFTVTFRSWSPGPRNATLRIASNSPDGNPFALMKLVVGTPFHHCFSPGEPGRGALMKLVVGTPFHHCFSPGEPGRGAARNLLLA